MMGNSVEAIGTMRTEISLPIFPLEHRCSICQIYHQDAVVFEELTHRLLLAHKRPEIMEWLKSAGFPTSERALYRHYSRHVRPYVSEVLVAERRVRAQIKALEGMPQEEIASALSRSLASQALVAMQAINLSGLLSRATDADEATGIVIALTKLSKSLADIEHTRAQIDLNTQLVELRKLEVEQKIGALDQRSIRQIEAALREYPDLARQVRNALAASKAEPLAVLAETNAKNPNRKSSRGNRPRAGRQR
jgi:hypothetical protein